MIDVKDVKVFELTKDINGLAEGTRFERENGLFVTNITTEKVGEGYSFTKTETRKYSESIIERVMPALRVVEYTDEYNDRMLKAEPDKYEDSKYLGKPFKPRKVVRKQIAEYEKQLEALEAGETKFYDAAAKQEARTVWYNLIKALKWVINEDEQVC